MLTIHDLYDLNHTLAADYLKGFTYPWEALAGIKQMIIALGEKLDGAEYTQIAPQVWVHRTAVIAPTAYLGAPCIIGAHGGSPWRVYPWRGAGRGQLRGWQFSGAEERHSL